MKSFLKILTVFLLTVHEMRKTSTPEQLSREKMWLKKMVG